MSLVTWAKKNSRAMGKVGLYATGGILIGYPLLSFASNVYKGDSLEWAADKSMAYGFGISGLSSGAVTVDKAGMRNGIVRTGLGALAIYAAKKI